MRKPSRDETLLTTARARYKIGVEADSQQKARELEALQVYGGDVWPADVRASRAFRPADGRIPEVPARPCLNINQTREPVSQILNQERDNELQVEVVPADDFGGIVAPANTEEIELREGHIRRIQR